MCYLSYFVTSPKCEQSIPDLELPPYKALTPIQLFAAFTVADSDVPTGAAAPRGMNAIRITIRSDAIAFCLFVFIFPHCKVFDGQFVFDWYYILGIICSYYGGKRSKTTIH